MQKVYGLILFISLILISISFIFPSAQSPDAVATVANGSAYAATLTQLDKELASYRNRAEQMTKSWLALDLAAQAHLNRARLTGNYQDYAEAEQLLKKAFDLSGEIGGPHMTRASLNYSLHRLASVNSDLTARENRLLLSDIDKAQIIGLKADLDFYQGRYEKALEGYKEALEFDINPSNLFRMAVYYWRTAEFEEAEEYLNLALQENKDISTQLSAFFHLHKGLLDLDRGRYKEALAHYQEADEVFSGWWLIQEHIAEIYLIEGRLEEAKAIYERVVITTGNPEFMEALAEIAQLEGEPVEAQSWISQAQLSYQDQLNRFPEAAYGHALEHYLALDDQSQKTISLAEANYLLRPYGEAEILLAQAYFQAGQVDKARSLIEQSLKSVWRSAELHATAALIFNELAETGLAQQEKAKALALNPDALANLSWLGTL